MREREELFQKATCLAITLAADSEVVAEARSALRGRVGSAHLYDPSWLQGGIDAVLRALQQPADAPANTPVGDPEDLDLDGDEDPDPAANAPAPTRPEKRGRTVDSEGRDAGDDSGMAPADESKSANAAS